MQTGGTEELLRQPPQRAAYQAMAERALIRARSPKEDIDAAPLGFIGGTRQPTPLTWPARCGFIPPTLGPRLSGDSGMPTRLIIPATALVDHLRKQLKRTALSVSYLQNRRSTTELRSQAFLSIDNPKRARLS